MATLPLLAGERLLRTLRPHPVAFLPRFAVPLLGAAWGLTLLLLFGSAGFDGFARGDFGLWYLDPRPVQYVVWALGVAGLTVAALRLQRTLRAPAVVLALSAAWGLASGALFDAAGAALAWGTLLTGLAGVGLVEAQRRSHTYNITSRRLTLEGGLWRRRDVTYRWDRLRGLEGAQTLPGRFLKYGTLVPRVEGAPASDARLPPPALCLFGVAPYEGVQEEILELIERARAPPPPVEEGRPVTALSGPASTLSRIEELLAGGRPEGDGATSGGFKGGTAFLHED